MRAGDLNRRVRIEHQSGSGTLNDPIGWAELATVWGNVKMLTGKETLTSDADVGTASASIRIRYRTDITNGMRAIVDGVVFNIGAPLPDLAGRGFVDLPCTTGANDGQ